MILGSTSVAGRNWMWFLTAYLRPLHVSFSASHDQTTGQPRGLQPLNTCSSSTPAVLHPSACLLSVCRTGIRLYSQNPPTKKSQYRECSRISMPKMASCSVYTDGLLSAAEPQQALAVSSFTHHWYHQAQSRPLGSLVRFVKWHPRVWELNLPPPRIDRLLPPPALSTVTPKADKEHGHHDWGQSRNSIKITVPHIASLVSLFSQP